jgi:uncharacterized protein (TIGR03437 family)
MLCAALPLLAQTPAALTAKTATSKHVDLTWTGTSSTYSVQRRILGGTYAGIGTTSGTTFSDTQIDPYTTYQYEVVANTVSGTSNPSNEITVGPPPSGFTTAAAAPGPADSYLAQHFAYDISLAFDTNGDPILAWVFDDPNSDTDPSDTKIVFRSWNRASYQWNNTVDVAVVGDIATSFHQSISLASDQSTGAYVIASEKQDGSIRVFVSNDSGATWSQKASYTDANNSGTGPSVALRGGNLYLAYNNYAGLQYVNGTLSSAASAWISKSAPKVSGIDRPVDQSSASIALDSAGNPGITWWAGDLTKSSNTNLMLWRPSSGAAPAKVMDSLNNSTDGLLVKTQYFGLNPRVLVYVQRDNGYSGDNLYTSKSDDGGLTWATPVRIPPDGDSSTDYPADLALDSQGHGAVIFGENSSSGNYQCGNPKLARSNDFVIWTTCAVASLDLTSEYSVYPASVQAAFGGNDKLYLFWWDSDGIIMYREPPASAITGPTISSVSNGATHADGMVSGSWVEIKGANLSGTTRIWGSNDFNNGDALPTVLSGVQVKINGLLVPVYYISPTQVNVQAPASLSGTVSVQVINNGVPSNTLSVAAATSAPGLFYYTLGGENFPSALYNGTYTIVGDPALYAQAAKAKAGDIIQLYATGLGPSTSGSLVNSPVVFSSPVTVTIGTTNVTASYAGLVGVGLFQVNFIVPSIADGNYPLTIQTNGKTSQSGIILPTTH